MLKKFYFIFFTESRDLSPMFSSLLNHPVSHFRTVTMKEYFLCWCSVKVTLLFAIKTQPRWHHFIQLQYLLLV
jgi:hypothetical protein